MFYSCRLIQDFAQASNTTTESLSATWKAEALGPFALCGIRKANRVYCLSYFYLPFEDWKIQNKNTFMIPFVLDFLGILYHHGLIFSYELYARRKLSSSDC